MLIREACPDDLETIVEFNTRLAIDSLDKVPQRDTLIRGVERALASPDLCRYFLAEEEGRPLGQISITFEWSDWRNGMVWWLQSVYVAPETRGRGLFREMLEYIRARARADEDACYIRLYVLDGNARAQDVYHHCGMKTGKYKVYEIGLE